jgi:cytidyltransferase-like protein
MPSAPKTEVRIERVVAVSGGFDPIHIGHIRMMQEARSLGTKLVVILNNDHWLRKKKNFVFMPQEERAEILAAFPFVDEVVLTSHIENDDDRSICRDLALLKPDVFANGGDRTNEDEIPEAITCREHGIEMVFNIGHGGKVQSSSWLTSKISN